MTISKITIIDNIGYDLEDRGDIAVRIAKCTYVDGVLITREPHRFTLQAGDDIDLITADVNNHLVDMGFDPVTTGDIGSLKNIAAERWTTERVAARQARDDEQQQQAAQGRAQADAAAADAAAAEQAAEVALIEKIRAALAKERT